MANGLWGGLGKLLNMGALYVQHVQAARQAAQLGGEAAHRQLHDYLAALSDRHFAGFKVSVAMAASNAGDPALQQALGWIAAHAEALRDAPQATAAVLADGAAPAFEHAVARVTQWYELACAQRGDEVESQVASHATSMSDNDFQVFLGQLQQMHANLDAAIQQVRDNESSAWGGCVEDRIAYLSAKLRTGASDPQVEAQVARFTDQQQFLARLYDFAVACRAEARRPQAREPAQDAPERVSDTLDLDAVFGQFEALRQQALASGELRGERDFATRAWLAELEGVMRAKHSGTLSGPEAIAEMQRIFAKRQDLVRDAGPAQSLPEGSRAQGLATRLQALKGHAASALMGIPQGKTHRALTEMFTAVARCLPQLGQLADDAAAAAFEHTELRPLAQQAHALALLPHLTLARPFWECPRIDASAHRVFFAGETDLALVLGRAATARRLELNLGRGGRYYGQARWDQLRASHLCVFDWRMHAPGLADEDPAAAAQLAGIAYELGLALSLGRPVVIVAQPGQALPFDIDIEPLNLPDDDAAAAIALGEALDQALYGHQRIADDGCLGATREQLQALAERLGQRKVFERMGWLDEVLTRDPVAFHAAAEQISRTAVGVELITPAWASPAEADEPTVFHVTPFSLEWSDAGREAVRRACADADLRHSDGETAREARILQRIWDGIAAAERIVVDVTGLNPNVFIELGMAHALGRDTLIVERAHAGQPPPSVRNLEKIEFRRYADMRQLRSMVADWLRTR